MARKEESKEKVYAIPVNFIEGGRILNGMFKLRNFIEALILTAIFALIAFMIPVSSVYTRITIVIILAVPPFFLGIVGINGDTVFTFLLKAMRWKKANRVMVYDPGVKILHKTPLEVMMEEPLAKDKIISSVEEWRLKKKAAEDEKRSNTIFEFEEDNEISRIQNGSADPILKRKRKKAAPPPVFEDYASASTNDEALFSLNYQDDDT